MVKLKSNMEAILGQKVLAVFEETIYLESGEAYRFLLEGDCCSQSYYTPEAYAGFLELVGSTILSIKDTYGSSNPEVEAKYPEGDVLSWHFLTIQTDKGTVTLDWYDGWLEIVKAERLDPVVHDALLEGRPDALLLPLKN